MLVSITSRDELCIKLQAVVLAFSTEVTNSISIP
jgi:hypothetical protein